MKMLEKYGFKKLYEKGSAPTVVVGMSGGVDSSVSAYVLKWQGFNVIGLFMRNWEEKDEDGFCTAEADFNDVKRVCDVIEIPYYSVNFSKQYMDDVFSEFLKGLKQGFTPNPDILCNRMIKFGPFLDYADKLGAQFIATGHYARVKDGDLYKGADETKDQSYFLCGLSREQLLKAIFPIGHLEKQVVRQIAAELGLGVAEKKDSTGICFIGERKFRDFLKNYFGNQQGEIRTMDGTVLGNHIGLMYYTLGQRKGLGIGGQKGYEDGRWFVVKKDLQNNILFVSNKEDDELFSKTLVATNFNWISSVKEQKFECKAKTRYRQPDQECKVEVLGDNKVKIEFLKPQRAITPGQWAVLYSDDKCLGGGQIVF